MSYKLKLGVALAAAALALPTLAAAQDPSTRTDITVIGAVLSDDTEQVADRNVGATPEMPIVYEDDPAPEAGNTEEAAASSAAEAE